MTDLEERPLGAHLLTGGNLTVHRRERRDIPDKLTSSHRSVALLDPDGPL
jgi:hypothetical protein